MLGLLLKMGCSELESIHNMDHVIASASAVWEWRLREHLEACFGLERMASERAAAGECGWQVASERASRGRSSMPMPFSKGLGLSA